DGGPGEARRTLGPAGLRARAVHLAHCRPRAARLALPRDVRTAVAPGPLPHRRARWAGLGGRRLVLCRRRRLARRRCLEERFPAGEQRGEVVARRTVRRDEVDVRPVLGEPALELRDPLLPALDLALDQLDRALLLSLFRAPPRLRSRRWGRLGLGGASLVVL